MKKKLSLFITFIILFSFCVIDISAKEIDGKITAELDKQLIEISEDSKIETCIWLHFDLDENNIEKMTQKECGLTAGTCKTIEDVDLYKKTYNRILGEIQSKNNQDFINHLEINEKDIIFSSVLSNLVIANLSKEQVYTAEKMEIVQYIDLYDVEKFINDFYPEPDPLPGIDNETPIFLKAVRNYYGNNDIQENDIKIDYIQVLSSPMALVKFTVDNYNYNNEETFIVLGDYVLKTTESQPLIFGYDDSLRTIDEVYRLGGLDDTLIDLIAGFEDFELIKNIVYGDADMNGVISIMDATYIQAHLAKLIKFSNYQLLVSDIDRNASVTIIDATAIQLKLAKVE